MEHPKWPNLTDWRSTGTFSSDFLDQLTSVPRVNVPPPQPQKNEVSYKYLYYEDLRLKLTIRSIQGKIYDVYIMRLI